MPYEDSINKQAIRRVWDLEILKTRRASTARPLFYFGMCGPEMHDVLDWREVLDDCVDAAEEPGANFDAIHSRMYDVSTLHGINYELMRAKVESVIARGADDDNARLRRANVGAGKLEFTYDLVNLDFDGGLINMARHRAIETLLINQQATPFTLFVTYNVRHQAHGAIVAEMENLRRRLDAADVNVIDWYADAERPEALRFKAVMPSIVAQAASQARLDCVAYPPIRYQGHRRAVMLHFAFDLSPRLDAFRGHARSDRDLVTLPLIESIDGALCVSAHQDPSFTAARCEQELGFLSPELRAQILAERGAG